MKNPIVFIRISNTKKNIVTALIDSGADVSLIKNIALNDLNQIDKSEVIPLSSFTNNQIFTLGTYYAEVQLNGKRIIQKFHIVPKGVRMQTVDVILGKDFLTNNGIVVDFGKGVVYSNPDIITIEKKQIKKPSILKNNIKMIKNNNKKEDKLNKNETILSRNIYECLPIEDENVLYKSDEICKEFLNKKFNDEIISEINSKNYKVLLGCKEGVIFCNELDKENEESIDYFKKPLSRNIKSSSKVGKKKPRKNVKSSLNIEDRVNNQKTFNPKTSDQSSGLKSLMNFCSSDINTCILNKQNIRDCFRLLFENIQEFVICLKIGTNLSTIINTFNIYNSVIIEIKKFLVKERAQEICSDLEKYSINLGKLTLSFKDIVNKEINLENILQFLIILRKDLRRIIKLYNNVEVNEEDILSKNELNNNIIKTISTIYEYKNSIIIPARSEKIISIILDSNEEQLCLSREIQYGVYVGNCAIKPENNIGIISILNTTEVDVCFEEIYLEIVPLENYNILNIETMNNENTRINNLLSKVSFENLNEEESMNLKQILCEYNEIFYLEGDTLTHTNSITHKIDLESNSKPIYCKPFRLPFSQRQEIDKQVEKMLREDIIQPTSSSWNFPLLVVPKKSSTDEKKFRVVVDYSKLNDISIGDTFPMQNITDLLDSLGKSNLFSVLDLSAGYHQILVDPKDRHLTAFNTGTHSGKNLGNQFEFKRMPFGLKNAPATFNRLMRTAMSGLQGISCLIYLDDIIIFSKNLESHMEKLREVFDRLVEHNLKLQPEKCHFLRKEVTYLGHLISENSVKPDPLKTSAIDNFPQPKNVKGVQSFLGLVGYYRKFIKGFADIAKPLTSLLKKNNKFIWSEECINAFNKLKQAITSEPVLQHPNFSERFILSCDASNVAISGILSQGKLGEEHPIAYVSRTLQPTETRYSTTEKEMLAIFWSIKQYRPYLYGNEFIVISDHKPLQWIFKTKDSTNRLFRWRLQLAEYDFIVLHKPGRHHTNVDCLSRYVGDSNININSEMNIETFDKDIKRNEIKNQINDIKITENKNGFECNVITRRAAREAKEIELQNEDDNQKIDSQINEDENYIKYLIENKSFENCLEYIKICHNYSDEIKERSITKKKFKSNEIYLVSNEEFLALNFETIKLGKNIYICKKDELNTFYINIKNEITKDIDYENFYETFIDFKNILLHKKITTICCIKTPNFFGKMNFTKVKQIL